MHQKWKQSIWPVAHFDRWGKPESGIFFYVIPPFDISKDDIQKVPEATPAIKFTFL